MSISRGNTGSFCASLVRAYFPCRLNSHGPGATVNTSRLSQFRTLILIVPTVAYDFVEEWLFVLTHVHVVWPVVVLTLIVEQSSVLVKHLLRAFRSTLDPPSNGFPRVSVSILRRNIVVLRGYAILPLLLCRVILASIRFVSFYGEFLDSVYHSELDKHLENGEFNNFVLFNLYPFSPVIRYYLTRMNDAIRQSKVIWPDIKLFTPTLTSYNVTSWLSST